MFKNLILIFTLTLLSITVFAGSSGYVFEGRTYYIHKDGESLNEAPSLELSRAPASVEAKETEESSMILYFNEDDTVRCYYWDKRHQAKSKYRKKDSNIHCFKLSDLRE